MEPLPYALAKGLSQDLRHAVGNCIADSFVVRVVLELLGNGSQPETKAAVEEIGFLATYTLEKKAIVV
jgi:hypothetical protein